MKRRELITLLGGAAAALTIPARARNSRRCPGSDGPTANPLNNCGGDPTDAYRLAGVYSGRIKGDNQGDLPVQQATKVELILSIYDQ